MSNQFDQYDDAWEEGWEWLRRLQLSARPYNALVNNNVKSFDDLKAMDFYELVNLPGLGVVGAKEILERVKEIEENGPLSLVDEDQSSVSHVNSLSASFKEASEISIYNLPLSARTLNALYNNDVKLVSDLSHYTLGDLVSFQGFGQRALNEVIDLVNRPDLSDFLKLKEVEKLSLDEFLSTRINRSHLAIYDSYYGLTENRGNHVTLQIVSEQYGVTRERIRQIVKKVSDKVAQAMNDGILDTSVYDILIANVNKPMHDIPELSNIYRKEGLVRIFTENNETALSIYTSPEIRSEWLVASNDDAIGSQVRSALAALRAQVAPVSIRELARILDIKESVVYDLSNVTIDSEGLIALNSNKVALGTDVRQKIIDYMDKKISPVTIAELCRELNLNENQVKGRFYHMEEIVNVGKSTYGLAKYGYTGETIADLSVRLLSEAGQPLHIDKITRFVTKYKVVEDSSVLTTLSVYPGTFTNIGNGYYALTEWGYKSSTRTRNIYEVPPTDAVLSVLNEAERALATKEIVARVRGKYGEKTTDKAVTISSVCVKLFEQGLLDKLGTEHSPFYILRRDS